MTPATTDRPGKRERLVASARDLLYEQGVERTTLAQIAQAADVPPGNVYYYFKTRDELVKAVVESRLGDIRARLGELDELPSPGARLKALAGGWSDIGDAVAAHGCPIGSLGCELNKRRDDTDELVSALFTTILEWTARQFRELGRRDARDLAVTFLAGVQGGAVLTNALRDPKIMAREARRLARWIDSLS